MGSNHEGDSHIRYIRYRTLGFYIDSAFADLRYDKAIVLIILTAGMNLGIDVLSRTIRSRLRLQTRINVV